MDYRLYAIDSDCIDFLRSDPRLTNVFDNEEKTGKYGRKYIGILILVHGIDFYAPFSSPKPTDYQGDMIRRSVVPIIRMVETDPNGHQRLLGTIKLNNMIPAPKTVCHLVDIASLRAPAYQSLLWKELAFVHESQRIITKTAAIVFSEKTNEALFRARGEPEKGYLRSCVDFL